MDASYSARKLTKLAPYNSMGRTGYTTNRSTVMAIQWSRAQAATSLTVHVETGPAPTLPDRPGNSGASDLLHVLSARACRAADGVSGAPVLAAASDAGFAPMRWMSVKIVAR